MIKSKTILRFATPIIAMSAVSCSSLTPSGGYTENQFIGTWKHEVPGMYFLPSLTSKVVNRTDGTSTTTVTAVGKAPKPNSTFKSKLKPGHKLMDTTWKTSGSYFIETSEKGKQFKYKIISVSPSRYELRNAMGQPKVYERMK